MAQVRHLQVSFSGGEVTPEFFGQIGDAKYRAGLKTLRNFIPLPHGPAVNRPGTAFVREVADSSKATRLIPFTFSTTQTMVLEFGDGYIRFHTDGATLLAPSAAAWLTSTAYAVSDLVTEAGTKYYCQEAHTSGTFATDLGAGKWYALPATGEYEIPAPYGQAHVPDLKYVQSADVLTLVHPSWAPRELRRYGATDWELTIISFTPDLDAPTNVAVAATVGTGAATYTYVTTTVGDDGLDESYASSSDSVTNDLLTSGNYNTITWTAASGAKRYNVYKESNGLFGYIGQTDGTSFIDDNITPDLSKTPPEARTPFTGSGNFPGAVSYFEQRRVFGGTTNAPQNLWMTRTGTESNMSYSIPARDDDAIALRVAAREANTIRHLVPLGDLLLLTGSAEWRMTSINSDAITPTSVSVKPQSYVGANEAQPAVVNNTVVYAAARGGHVRELAYNWQANGFTTGDLSLRAPHLFDGYDIEDIQYAQAPVPIVWCVSSSGDLLSLTYVPEERIGAWAHHDTDGAFESCCVVSEGDEDRLYCIVRRTIGGATKRYVERMASRMFADAADAFFVDCGATYDGAAATTITGLSHLEGETVAILADGAVVAQQVVTSGQITLDNAASVVQVGLPITADLETLPLAMQVDNAFGAGRVKNINKAMLRVYRSSGIKVGPDASHLVDAKHRAAEPYGSPPALRSDVVEVVLTPTWSTDGGVYVRQTDPLPLTLVSMALEVSVGG